jgi:cytoskeleton protein RodZ
MDDLGARLKQVREERGLPLKDIATRTKISVAALEALERNDLSRLPGGIFGRAFVRAYALELELDPDKTVADFQASLEEVERKAAERGALRVEITDDDRAFLERQRRAVRLLRVVVVTVAVAAVLLLAWRLQGAWSSPPVNGSAPAGGARGSSSGR